MSALITIENLSKVFRGRQHALPWIKGAPDVRAVDDVSFDIARGETLALVGESGCGKSTTGRLLLKLTEPSSGRIVFDGQDLAAARGAQLKKLRRNLQMIFQDPFGSLSPRRTIAQVIAEPLVSHGLVKTQADMRDRVAELLLQVGLSPDQMSLYPRQFSGGQRQRIGIARAISVGPSLIVADEPVSALDVSVQAQIVNLMQDLQRSKGLSYLFVSHDLRVVRHIADRVAVMYLGRLIEIGPKAKIFSSPQHPYTQALLSAAPKVGTAGKERQRIILEGDVPSPTAVPPGCSFHTRCPLAADICRVERPPLRPVADGQLAACHFATPNPIPVADGGHAVATQLESSP